VCASDNRYCDLRKAQQKISARNETIAQKYQCAISRSLIKLPTISGSTANDFPQPFAHHKSVVVLRGDCSGMDFTALAPTGDQSSASHCPMVESEVTRYPPCGKEEATANAEPDAATVMVNSVGQKQSRPQEQKKP
jgi:hypothetical protein